MPEAAFVNDARVMSKGRVTIPKNVRAALILMQKNERSLEP